MKNLFRPLLVLTGCIVLVSCVSQKQFKGLKTDYTKLQTEYQESQLQLRENQARSTSLEERLAEAQRNNSELRKSLSDMQSILNKSLTQSSQGNMNMGKLIDEINASNCYPAPNPTDFPHGKIPLQPPSHSQSYCRRQSESPHQFDFHGRFAHRGTQY